LPISGYEELVRYVNADSSLEEFVNNKARYSSIASQLEAILTVAVWITIVILSNLSFACQQLSMRRSLNKLSTTFFISCAHLG
jgi:hypothetical protein